MQVHTRAINLEGTQKPYAILEHWNDIYVYDFNLEIGTRFWDFVIA